MAPRAHAKLSASSAERWINCPGSVALSECFPESPGSIYTEEGTLAHAMAEEYLKTRLGRVPIKLRKRIKEFYDEHPELGGSYEQMEEYIIPYCEWVLEEFEAMKTKLGRADLKLEERFSMEEWIPEGFGTSDVVIYGDGALHIIDLKYGKGVEVSAEDNPQLKLYALGTLSVVELIQDIEEVKMTIYQPRLDNVSTYRTTAKELKRWGEEVVKPAAQAALGENAKIRAGESQCRWCPAKDRCKVRAKHYEKLLYYKNEALLSNADLARILKISSGLKDWVDGIKELALKEALEGEGIPGFKVVEGRANRKYTVPDEQIAQAAVEAGYDESLVWERKLLTLSNMEKLVGKKAFPEIFKGMWEKPEGKPTLVPDTDKRPAIAGSNAEDDFADDLI